jgi:hypothetical protein
MNKLLQILLVVSLTMISTASRAHPGHGPHYWEHNRYGWVAPLVIGSAVGYAVATRPQPIVIQQPPNIYYQPQQQAPYGYHYENILDANCNCYRLVLVQN